MVLKQCPNTIKACLIYKLTISTIVSSRRRQMNKIRWTAWHPGMPSKAFDYRPSPSRRARSSDRSGRAHSAFLAQGFCGDPRKSLPHVKMDMIKKSYTRQRICRLSKSYRQRQRLRRPATATLSTMVMTPRNWPSILQIASANTYPRVVVPPQAT